MDLIIIGSSSQGNSYILKGINQTLLLECGVKLSKVKDALNFDLSQVIGCLLTHGHMDHAKYIREYANAGIDVYTSKGTIASMTSHRLHPVEHNKKYQIGEFQVLPLHAEHDCQEPFMFLIRHQECGDTLFCTDSMYIPYSFKGLNNLLIEANYDNDIIDERVANGADKSVRDRVLFSHMSIQTLSEYLAISDTTRLNNVVLLHLSAGNSNSKQFTEKVKKIVPGSQVWIANKNMKIEFNRSPF